MAIQGDEQMVLKNKLEEIISQGELVLPMLPSVTSEVLSLVNHESTDAQSLSKIIQSDQSLASHVMRVANSALYSQGASLVSLQQAIVRLGMGKIAEIAIAVSLDSQKFEAPGFDDLTRYLWQSPFASALWAKEIARKARKNVEATFLSALLHDIGKPVVLQTLIGLANEQSINLKEEEAKSFLSLYHQRVGLEIAKKWKLPPAVVATIKFSHDFELCDEQYKELVMIVCAADYFARYHLESTEMNRDTFSAMSVFNHLNLYQEDIEELLLKTEEVNTALSSLQT